jgi:hypothetical protein
MSTAGRVASVECAVEAAPLTMIGTPLESRNVDRYGTCSSPSQA